MKRAFNEEPSKRQHPEDTIVIPKAKTLLPEELDLVSLHRDISQYWRNASSVEDGYDFISLGLPTPGRPEESEAVCDDEEDDRLFQKLLASVELSYIPQELIQIDYTQPRGQESINDMPDGKQSIRRIEEVMEREANEVDPEDTEMPTVRQSLPIDDDAMDVDLADYHYSFCEEDDGY
ncbi:hypothetical protein BBOV_III009555 [Babesia bovis T2Bo]|uniref:hypothetical protein n=1 Tax=Babesia bovis T2Bo TaxID=484906 RepID=UPI001C36618B|nr:hypothetical protein BBOV_III009555 [Babesia bovis T2Bo]KAG6440040.1 hypothetical protein BBOV_III009555 [Babesia bovis T2Bo]